MLTAALAHRAWLSSPLMQPAVALLASLTAFVSILATGDPSLFVVVVLLPLVLSAGMRAPFAVAIAYYALTAFRLPEGQTILMNLGIPRLAGIALLCALGFRLFLSRERFIELAPQILFLGGFFVFASLGVVTSSIPNAVWDTWSEGLTKALLAGLALAIFGTQLSHLSMLAWVSVFSGLLLAPIAIWNKVHHIGLVEGTRAVISPGINSILADPNFSALMLIIPMGFALAIAALSKSAMLRFFAASAGLLFIAGILSTQSRGGLFGLLAVIVVVAGLLVKSRALALMAAAVLAPVFALLMGLGSRQSGGLDGIAQQGLDESASHRLIAWDAALNMAVANPISGVGIGTFKFNFFFYTEVWVGRAMDVHSTWLQVLAETGFFGFAFYILMIGFSVLAIYRALKIFERDQSAEGRVLRMHALGVLAAAAGFIVAATFISSAISGLAFGIVGTSVMLHRLAMQRSAEAGQEPQTIAPPAAQASRFQPAPHRHLQISIKPTGQSL